MKRENFVIGAEFTTPTGRWRCTDVGTRVIVAIQLRPATEEKGPPYGVPEVVFDEYDMPGCVLTGARYSTALSKKVEALALSTRPRNCMRAARVDYLGDLVQLTRAQVLRTPNIGRASCAEIEDKLRLHGLQLGMQVQGWQRPSAGPPAEAPRVIPWTDLDKTKGIKFSLPTMHQMARQGRFPRPVRIGRRVAFVESEVDAWLAARAAERSPALQR